MEILRVCKVTGKEFSISEGEQEVLRRIGELNPVLNGEPLPLPQIHPYEALRQIFSFSGLRCLFKVPSAVSGEPVITRYNPELGIKVCSQEEFFSAVDNTEAGRPYDFSRSFFDQYFELARRVIKPPLNRTNCENSDYTNGAINLKDCYLCFSAFDSQDCLYCLGIKRCRDCIDVHCSMDCELCYSSRDLTRCYLVQHSYDCRDSQELFACLDCRNCRNCFGCVDLERKEYQIFNEQVSKERYEEFVKEQNLSSYLGRIGCVERCERFILGFNHQPKTIINCADSSGAYLERCEAVIGSQGITGSRFCGYLILGANNHYCYRGAGLDNEIFHTANCYGAQVNAFCFTVFGGRNNLYCASMYNGCSDCFGCIALNRKEYCVLNCRYSRTEYLELTRRIVAAMKERGEWGEWFPPRYSWHYYEEAGVHEYLLPIPLAEARRRGYRVKGEERVSAPSVATPAADLPDDLFNSAKVASGKPVICLRSGRAFNVQKKEIEFLLKHEIPIPRLHWQERLRDILATRELIPGI